MIKVELQETMGNDRRIAEAAWTSSTNYVAKDLKTEKDVECIVNMLADLKHSVPFESVIFRFWLRIPIAADRQHMTHRIGSHSGMSGRYRTMPDDFLAPTKDVKDIADKMGENINLSNYSGLCRQANLFYRTSLITAKNAEKAGTITNSEYKRYREFMRGVLPQNNMTERVTLMNLRSFANYQKLRNSHHAQVEIREMAEQMLDLVEKSGICPIALEALKRNGWNI